MKTLRFLAAASVAWCLTSAALSHDTWLLPRGAAGDPPFVASLDLTSGMGFPKLDHAVQPDRIAKARIRLNGRSTNITDLALSAKSLVLRASIDAPGVAAIWVESKPRSIELTAAQVAEYFEEIDATESIRKAWAAVAEPKRWRETYVKLAKTFVRSGKGGDAGAWAEPVGMALEIVPERDPTRLRAGDEFPVRVFRNAGPARGFALGLVGEGDAHGLLRTTDENGRVRFRLERSGQWLLRGTDLRRSTAKDIDWESEFTTLTVEVR